MNCFAIDWPLTSSICQIKTWLFNKVFHQLTVRWKSCKPWGSLKPRCPIYQMGNHHKKKTYDPIMMIILQHKGSSLLCKRKKKLKIRSFSRRNSIIKDYGRLGNKQQKNKLRKQKTKLSMKLFLLRYFFLSSQ